MILETKAVTPVAITEAAELDLSKIELASSDQYTGDSCELAEMAALALAEMHNLTIAMARFEHSSYLAECASLDDAKAGVLSEAGLEKFKAAAGEYFKKTAEFIKTWWNKFVAWLGTMWSKMQDLLGNRMSWLARHKAELTGKSDEALKGTKVSIGKAVLGTDFVKAVNDAIGGANAAIASAAAMDGATPADTRTAVTKAKDAIGSLVGAKADQSMAKACQASLIGESEEVELSKAVVGKLIGTAENTMKAMMQMKAAKGVADAALRFAVALESSTAVADGREKANARVAVMNGVSPAIQQIFGALSSCVNAANGQVMQALMKAAAAKEAAPAAAAATPKNEATSLLDQFL